MGTLRKIAKRIPALPFVYRALRSTYVRYQLYQLKSKSTENVFTDIYRSNNEWGGKDSVSGVGSSVHQTKIITSELLALFRALNISTMLDIPCGDFHWMKRVDLNNIDYTGADIVKELIQTNRAKYARDGVRFQHLNLLKDKLPKVDLIFCRDCLVHFSFADIGLALGNVCNSQSEYFLTTTFTGRKDNHEIVTGQWRPINLELVPFVFPKPLKITTEGCTEGNGAYEDKALGLWRIADIRESLTRRCT
jgi:SAM-dependent methyltransferase